MKWFRLKPVVEEPKDEKHYHDWESVYNYSMIEIANQFGMEFIVENEYEFLQGPDFNIRPSDLWGNAVATYTILLKSSSGPRKKKMPTVVKKVCLDCGECYDGLDKYKQIYNVKVEKAKEEKRRKELAKKMWEDGCNGN